MSIGLLSLIALANFYVLSRLTVDDAFITWRYGKNLVEAGVWGYNPTTFDLTQAYTNPIYAILSIIPAYLHIDVVLFFKLFAILTLVLPVLLIYRPKADKARFAQLYLLFLALPASMIHVFAGLETFLFIALLGGLFIALIETRFWLANGIACLLILVRPEAWLLVGLLPAYIFFAPAFGPRFRLALRSFVLVGGTFAVYAVFHYWYFWHVLPNTFYIKSSRPFSLNLAIYFLAYLLPAFVLLLTPYKRLLAFILLVYIPMIYCYSSSDLQMNYAGRFAFHIWGGIFWLLAYLVVTQVSGGTLLGKSMRFWSVAGILGSMLLILKYTTGIAGAWGLANWTPQSLEVRPAIVATIKCIDDRYHIQRIATSDAGSMPYNIGLVSLDPIGLGSALVAHEGMTDEIAQQYQPDLAILMRTSGKLLIPNEVILKQWLLANGRKPICEMVLRPDRSLELYARQDIPELHTLCDAITHRPNAEVGDTEYFWQHIKNPPWVYWRNGAVW